MNRQKNERKSCTKQNVRNGKKKNSRLVRIEWLDRSNCFALLIRMQRDAGVQLLPVVRHLDSPSNILSSVFFSSPFPSRKVDTKFSHLTPIGFISFFFFFVVSFRNSTIQLFRSHHHMPSETKENTIFFSFFFLISQPNRFDEMQWIASIS